MPLFGALAISGSALTAERLNMDVISANLANMDVTGARPYQARATVFTTLPNGGVAVAAIVTDPTPGPLVYDPANPAANASGFVNGSNVNPTVELVNLVAAERSYEANATAITSEKSSWQAAMQVLA
jgi:flagellar basal-body rod protein FlgC